jgi:hypothetical protein
LHFLKNYTWKQTVIMFIVRIVRNKRMPNKKCNIY